MHEGQFLLDALVHIYIQMPKFNQKLHFGSSPTCLLERRDIHHLLELS